MFKPIYLERNDDNFSYLTILYENDDTHILSTFMNDDVTCFGESILKMLKSLLNDEVSIVDTSFNMSHILANKDKTSIVKLFDNDDNELVIATSELYSLVYEWLKKLREFEEGKF